MKRFGSIVGAVFAAALFIPTLSTASAQDAKQQPPTNALPPVPRTADGHPDLNGVWESTTLSITLEAGLEQGHPIAPFARSGFGGPPPYTQAALAKHQEYVDRKGIDDPMTRCLPVGVPRITIQPMPFQIVQTPGKIVILYEYFSLFRVIPTNGGPHPSDVYPTFMGDSVAHWEGDTLVIDATGFNDKTWLVGVGTYHSEALHVTERFTRTDYNNISYDAIMEDPQVFTKPWTFHSTLIYRPNDRLLEFACMEGNEDMIIIQALRDKEDKAKQDKLDKK